MNSHTNTPGLRYRTMRRRVAVDGSRQCAGDIRRCGKP
jgi:hypothetical protein